jgi:hypothetical protein
MAREKDFEERRRQREREDNQGNDEESKPSYSARIGTPAATQGNFGASSAGTEKLVELIERALPLIEQLNNLYNQYISGVERCPPLERRKQLDQLMATLTLMSKPTPAYQFRFNTLNSSYLTHRERWERLCKDLESGKIKRTAGPHRG